MKKLIKLLGLLLLLLVFTTYTPSPKFEHKSLIFQIKFISIEGKKNFDLKKLKIDLEQIKGKNLFFLNYEDIKNIFNEFDYISTFKIKKIYPDTIKIFITEKQPFAIYIDGKNKFYVNKNGELFKYYKSKDYIDLPYVYGKKINFNNFFITLETIDFQINLVKSFYYFDIGRWDIILKNNKIVKLPSKNYIEAIKNFNLLSKNKSFDKYKIFDYRIKDQLILN